MSLDNLFAFSTGVIVGMSIMYGVFLAVYFIGHKIEKYKKNKESDHD